MLVSSRKKTNATNAFDKNFPYYHVLLESNPSYARFNINNDRIRVIASLRLTGPPFDFGHHPKNGFLEFSDYFKEEFFYKEKN